MRRLPDWVMAKFARILIRVFFRKVELEGGENLPASGPVVVVANHINGLVDGLLLMATLPRYPRFLGKSTLFKILPLWPFLKLAGVIPVYRTVDAVAGDHNASAFALSGALLRSGGVVALFPEGISHNEVFLQPLKTGAARIALEAGVDGGVGGVTTIAVGLVYDAKARFRSRALVRLAQPVGVEQWADAYRADSHAAVRALTDDLAAQISTVSPTYTSWSQAEVLSRIAEVVVRSPGEGLPSDVQMTEQVGVASRLAAAPPDTLGDLFTSFDSYERDLELLGLDDAQVAAGYRRGRLRLAVFWSAVKVAIAVPFAALGVLVHIVPYEIVKQLAKKPTNEGIKATVKLLGCFASFVLVYAALGIIAGRAYGPWVGFVVAVAAPLCGYSTVWLTERVKGVGGLVDGYRTVTQRRDVIDSVLVHRKAVVADADEALVGS